VRCICIGQDRILPIHYDPKQLAVTGLRGRYIHHTDHDWIGKELLDRVVNDAVELNKALGYDMNSVEFAVRDGVPYAIDFTNPAPDMAVEHITEPYFDTVVGWMVDLAVSAAKGTRSTRDRYDWSKRLRDVKPQGPLSNDGTW
jgi:hypothetical protein